MNIIIYILLSLSMALKLFAQDVESTRATIAAMKASKIELLVLEKATFEEALNVIQNEWTKQHPDKPFAVAVTDYRRADPRREERPPVVTLKVRDVSFLTALRYLGDSTKRRLGVSPGLLRMEEVAWIEEDYFTKDYPISADLLRVLNLTTRSTPSEIASVYKSYGVNLADWMELRIVDDTLEVHAFERQHQQVAGINILLESGFKIAK